MIQSDKACRETSNPAIGLLLVLSVDWFIGMARPLGNLIGDRARAIKVSDGEELADVTAG